MVDRTYIGEDGLKYCSLHNKPMQRKINFSSEKSYLVDCMCEECSRLFKAEKNRQATMAGSRMLNWTFENDDCQRYPDIRKALMKYCEQFGENAKSILLYGDLGTGKSFYAACVANELMRKGYTVYITNFSQLRDKLQESFDGRQKFINSLMDYDLIFIDDLGSESETQFMQETVYKIINSRYVSGLPFIITTNFKGEDFEQPSSTYYARIFDRLFEMCVFFKMEGASRRRSNFAKKQAEYKRELGL